MPKFAALFCPRFHRIRWFDASSQKKSEYSNLELFCIANHTEYLRLTGIFNS